MTTINSCSSSICPSSCFSSDNELDDCFEDADLTLISTYQQNIECPSCKDRDNLLLVEDLNKYDHLGPCCSDERVFDVSEVSISMEKLGCKEAINPGPPIITSDEERGPEDANLFVFHLPNGLTNFDLFLLFRRFGDLRSSHVMTNKQTNLSRGYGFVSYSNKHEADVAIDAMNGFLLGSKKLKVERKRAYSKTSRALSSAPPSQPSSRRSSFDSHASSTPSRNQTRNDFSSVAFKW